MGYAIKNERGRVFGLFGTAQDITERKRAEEELLEVSGRLLRAEDEERRRIAKELHDATAQDLVAVMLTLDSLRDGIAARSEDEARRLEDSLALLEKCAHDVRTLAYVLHPPRLDEAGLAGAIRHYAAGFHERTGIAVKVEIPADLHLSNHVELIIFRIVQECLGNIHRHAGSPTAAIGIRHDETSTVLEVSDAGHGLSPAVTEVGGPGCRRRYRRNARAFAARRWPSGDRVRHPRHDGARDPAPAQRHHMKDVNILIADDHELMRDGIKARLEKQPGWKVCAEASDGRRAVELAVRLQPAVAVLDIAMAELNGIDAARQIRKGCPDTEVLILTMQESEDLIREALAAGARGFVLKTDAGRLLTAAVEALLQHKPFFTAIVSDVLLAGFLDADRKAGAVAGTPSRLTPREREVLQLLAEAKTSKEAAARLGVSVKTVDAHRANIMRKLDLHSVTELVRYAVRNKIIEA